MQHSRPPILAILPAILLAACATPEVDRSDQRFDETIYRADLDECSGGVTWSNVLTTTECVSKGAMVGFVAGAGAGAASNANDWRATLTGLSLGSFAGFWIGAAAANEEHAADVGHCLEGKGYRLSAPVPTTRRESARKFFGTAWGAQ